MSTTWVIVAVLATVIVGALLFVRSVGSEAAPDVAVLSQLRQAGSDLSKPHEVEFFTYFPDEASARKIASSLEKRSFRTEVKLSAADKPQWLVLATRLMLPEVSELVRLRTELTELSHSENGNYDGWGTPVVK